MLVTSVALTMQHALSRHPQPRSHASLHICVRVYMCLATWFFFLPPRPVLCEGLQPTVIPGCLRHNVGHCCAHFSTTVAVTSVPQHSKDTAGFDSPFTLINLAKNLAYKPLHTRLRPPHHRVGSTGQECYLVDLWRDARSEQRDGGEVFPARDIS